MAPWPLNPGFHPPPPPPPPRLPPPSLSFAITAAAGRSCPFPTNGPWADGAVMRDSVLSTSATLVGATGPLSMSVGENDDGRDVDTATFCAVNLKPHASQGARFEVISTVDGGSLESDDGEGFQVRVVGTRGGCSSSAFRPRRWGGCGAWCVFFPGCWLLFWRQPGIVVAQVVLLHPFLVVVCCCCCCYFFLFLFLMYWY